MEQSRRIAAAPSIEPLEARTTTPVAGESESGHALSWIEAARIVVVALSAAAVWFHLWEPFARVSLIGVLGVLIGGWPIFKEAAGSVAARRMTMELSMAVAIVAAAAISRLLHRAHHHSVCAARRGARGHDGFPGAASYPRSVGLPAADGHGAPRGRGP